jgi:protein involved in polysaccharide export with SLBB domain
LGGIALVLTALLAGSGCQTTPCRQGSAMVAQPHSGMFPGQPEGQAAMPRLLGTPAAEVQAPYGPQAPRELCKTVLPPYRIEPPDILLIDAVRAVPRGPYSLRTLDALLIQVQGTLPNAPVNGVYRIEPGGAVRLGYHYGSVPVAGLTVNDAERAIEMHLRAHLRQPVVSATLADISVKQQIAGQHLVAPDGTVTLGAYGTVPVVGMTVSEARKAIENHLAHYLDEPEISLEVYAYNSKVYYVITQGAGLGDGVYRFPVTGNETVLDAISQINGLQQVSSKRIWIARPTEDPCVMQVLPVNWEQITAQGIAATNYQIFPGDRIFVAEDRLVALDTAVAKLTSPFERIMGFSLLGVGTTTRFSGPVLRGGGNPNSNF